MSEKALFRTVVLAAFAVSVMHYTDNYLRFDEYPNDMPDLVTRPSIPAAWVVFTLFAIAAWVFYDRGERRRAAACLAVYSLSGLIGPLHYTSGPMSDFDAFQHVNIGFDTVAGLATLALAVAVWRAPKAAG